MLTKTIETETLQRVKYKHWKHTCWLLLFCESDKEDWWSTATLWAFSDTVSKFWSFLEALHRTRGFMMISFVNSCSLHYWRQNVLTVVLWRYLCGTVWLLFCYYLHIVSLSVLVKTA